MINWIQAWWQVRQSWSYLRHAYRCGLNLYDDVTNTWSKGGYAAAYAVAQVKPRTRLMLTRY
jgi:hypothetical protein